MTTDRQAVYLDVDVASSCQTLNRLLEARRCVRLLHVECSNTLFRKAFPLNGSNCRVAISADMLNDAVEVNVLVCATEDLSGYFVPEAHSDYQDVTFEIMRGDVLATAEGQVFYLDGQYDSISNISSIMQVSEASEEGDQPMRPDFLRDKIVVFLSKSDFAQYKIMRSSTSVSVALATTIVLPVLIEAVRILRDDSEGADDARRWVRALHRRVESLNLDEGGQPVILAQEMLELPIRRTLSSTRAFLEAQ